MIESPSRRFASRLFNGALVALASGTLLVACGGATPGVAPGGPAASGSSSADETANAPTLESSVDYSGSYDETVDYDATGGGQTQHITYHVHFTFDESVRLTTLRKMLQDKPFSTAPVSTSNDEPVTFSDSGTLTKTITPDNSNEDCSASFSGISGVGGWNASGGQPPVSIAIEASNPDGSLAKTDMMLVTAVLPQSGPTVARLIHVQLTSGPTSAQGSLCQQQGVLGDQSSAPGIYNDSRYLQLEYPGPTAPSYLVLPLETSDYSKNFSYSNTAPYTASGISGTDMVTAKTTLTVNGKGAIYAALGDSFASGDFAPSYDQDSFCLRSKSAYPALYETDKNRLAFLACKGYSSGQIQALEVPKIPANTTVVSVSAGGDDFYLTEQARGVFALLVDCIAKSNVPLLKFPCGTRYLGLMENQLPTVQSGLESLYQSIHKRVPDAKVYAMGYPNPFPDSFASGTCPNLEATNRSLIAALPPQVLPASGLAEWDVGAAQALVGALDTTIATAATASDVTYVDPTQAFAGHDACAGSGSWFFPLGESNLAAVLHPNEQGHMALEQLLSDAAGPAPS